MAPTSWLLVGAPAALDCYPVDYPVDVPVGYTVDELLALEAQRDELAQVVINRYQVQDWVAVNQIVVLSWFDWLKLSPIERRAIGICVEKVAAQRREKQREQEERFKAQLSHFNSRLSFPVQPHSHVTDLMKR